MVVDDEPTTEEFLRGLVDTIASNRLVDALRRKFRAQSFYEFFNRIFGTGFLLFLISIMIGGGALLLNQYQLSILDWSSAVVLVSAALILWFLLVMVSTVNRGETPLMGQANPQRSSQVLRVVAGVAILGSLGYELFISNPNPREGFVVTIIGALVTGMWLIGLAWFFGGLSGLYRIYTTDSKKED